MGNRAAIAFISSLFLAVTFGTGCTLAREGDEAAVKALRPAAFYDAVFVGHLENRNITEASGMVASRKNPGVLWIANDGGSEPVLYAIDLQGAHIGRVTIRNAQNIDWEDLAAFHIDHSATLLIADFGDNHARRKEYQLYFVNEPDISEKPDRFDFAVDWHRRVRFVYEDGPRDSEAVAVDTDNNQILLLTKRTVPSVLYSLPLRAENSQAVMVARRFSVVADMLPSPGAGVRFNRLGSQPTAMDISPDGSEIAILTYGSGGYLYRRPAQLGWADGFKMPPEWIGMPALRQAEALCFTADGRSLVVTSEQLPAPLYRLDRHSSFQRQGAP